ncbi:MAG TPA: sulfotransferase [Rhizomicrobium sp.]|nr:sulfotransferase [Rhizomicrobium sp.]
MPAGPDFICIGMQKAGTGWLYDQLQYHADFWMPPVKEFHYLDRDVARMNNPRKLLERWKRGPEKLANRRALDERDIRFLEEAIGFAGRPRNVAEYATLFRFKNGLLSGDVTPGYSTLTDTVVAEVAQGLPDVKIVLLVREPLDRAWSQICMAARNDNFDTGLLKDPTAFRGFLQTSELVNLRSFPSRIVARWREHAPRLAFGAFLLDDVIADPEATRRTLLAFLGADPQKPSGELAAGHNRKSKDEKLPLTDDIRAVMVEHFRQEILDCAKLFGGRAAGWPARYGL